MIISPFVFKSQAVRALKGNWQTALLVSFFATLPLTLMQLVQATRLPDVTRLTSYEAMAAAVAAIPQSTWTLLGLLSGLTMVLTPVLTVGCNFYFISRLRGEELGFKGLFSRMGSVWKAFLLYALIYIKTFLWSLLLIVPGVMAALRYAMAPFYLAEHPEIGVLEAIRKSKEAMKHQKSTLLMLELSFLIWLLGAMLCEMLLSGISVILALVASQFIQLVMATYLNASCAGFYLAVATPDGLRDAQAAAALWLRSSGLRGGSEMYRHAFGNDDNGDAEPGNTPEAGETDGDALETGEGADETLGSKTKPAPETKPDGDAPPADGDTPPAEGEQPKQGGASPASGDGAPDTNGGNGQT